VRPVQLYQQQAGDAVVRRLARDVGRLDRLLRVVRADWQGRGAASVADPPAVRWLAERAAALGLADARPEPLILGRHLQARGLRPGPRYRQVLDACFEAQLEGAFGDEEGAQEFLDAWLAREDSS
jgi:tRNA nucleotidyltransferase (CCA-adding enzyme)